MISPTQLRAARAALRWPIAELSARARVSPRTITAYETEDRDISPDSLARLQRALEDGGIEFRRDGSVRLVERKDRLHE